MSNLSDVIAKIQALEKGILANLSERVSAIATILALEKGILADLSERVSAIENHVKGSTKPMSTTTTNPATPPTSTPPLFSEIEEGVGVAGTVAQNIQQAVASQTSTLGKIESGLQEFLNMAPAVADLVSPEANAMATGIATAMQAMLAVIQNFHTGTVVPASNATK